MGQKNSITMDLRVVDNVPAPVARGQQLGTLTVKAGDQVLREFPLVAAEEVNRLSWGDLFLRVLKRAAMAKE